ncbi:MAG: PAS domain S-box protein [Nitrospira sp.]
MNGNEIQAEGFKGEHNPPELNGSEEETEHVLVAEELSKSDMRVDMTERTLAEDVKANLAAIIESSDDAIVSKNLNGIITSWNRGAERIFGYAAQEAIGQPVTMLMPPDRVDEEPGILQRIRRGEKIDHYETIRRRKDGTLLNISLTVSPIIDANGRVIGASKIARDITERKRAEDALWHSEVRLQQELDDTKLLQRLSADLANPQKTVELYQIIMDAAVEIMHSDFASMQMLYSERGKGGELRLLAFRGFNPKAAEFWEWVRADSTCACGVALHNGERTLVSDLETCAFMQETPDRAISLQTGIRAVQSTPLKSRAGRLIGMISTHWRKPHEPTDRDWRMMDVVARYAADLIERKQADEALQEAQVRLQRWNVELEQAVNIKTIELLQSQERLRALTAEVNLAEQRERKRLATELHDHLQQILVLGKLTIGRGSRAAVGLPACEQVFKKINDIFSEALTYTRTLVADLSPTVLRDQGLAAALEWLGDYMQKHNLTVTVTGHVSEGLRLPEDQVILLFQSVRELLINSAKHAGTGKATVRMEQHNARLRIEVCDEGVGFNLAADGGGEISPAGISSKFGLFSIRERMLALGGSFDLQSAPGQGTKATLSLPLAPCDRQSEQLAVKSAQIMDAADAGNPPFAIHHSLPRKNARIRVLLVDDHVMVRQGLRAVLDAYADVELIGEAGNGEEALRLVDQLQPAVVVMDINMPKMNGVEATRLIKSRYPEVAVIGLSVNADNGNHEAMTQAGASLLMTKEAAVGQLHDVIQEAVKKG